ncbi:hypothetical protein JTB14_030986 [Gonioctena quinquepunctata]|nr:hypothetical protein JTB14_030986 [Gonioctena quinquepunctata]
MDMSSVNEICRLCLSKEDLVWVFDKRFSESEDNMKDVIFITTGVEVHTKDIITQKICAKCCYISFKMFEFRKTSSNSDRFLKEQYRKMLETSTLEHKIPNTSVTIKADKRAEPAVK